MKNQKINKTKIRDVITHETQQIRLTFEYTNMQEVGWHVHYSPVQSARNHIKTGGVAASTVKEGRERMKCAKSDFRENGRKTRKCFGKQKERKNK